MSIFFNEKSYLYFLKSNLWGRGTFVIQSALIEILDFIFEINQVI